MGSASLDDVAEELKIKLPVDEYETFGGYIFGELGAVPDDGSQFELETDDLCHAGQRTPRGKYGGKETASERKRRAGGT